MPCKLSYCRRASTGAEYFSLEIDHTENIYPLEKHNSLRKELVQGKYVVLYSGNLAFKQGLEIIPQVIKELSHRRDIIFLICGDGPMRAELMQSCPMRDNVKFLPLQPYAKLNSLLACADVHLLPQELILIV